MVEPPVDIGNFRARAHAIAAEKKAKRQAATSAPPTNREAPEIITRRASDIKPSRFRGSGNIGLHAASFKLLAEPPKPARRRSPYHMRQSFRRAGTWPDETRAAVGNVLIWTSEDSPADTLVPRLMRMGADLERIHFIEQARPPSGKPRPFNPATDMPALITKAEAIGDIVLLILDPVVAAMPMTHNSQITPRSATECSQLWTLPGLRTSR